MVDLYQVANGHNNAAGLTTLSPQPASPNGLQVASREYSVSGKIAPDGEQFIELTYTMLEPEEKNTLDTAFGLSDTVFSNEVTVRIRGNDDTFANYNGTVEYPEIGRRARRTVIGWRDVAYIVHNLEAI